MNRRIITMLLLICILVSALPVTGCTGLAYPRNKRADDEISKAIYKEVGKDAYYQGKEKLENGVIEYTYLVRNYDNEDLLKNIVDVVNEKLKEEDVEKKICISIREEMSGRYEKAAVLYTYYENGNEFEQYEGLQGLYIRGTEIYDMGEASPYNKASTYINLSDIKSLRLEEKIVENAEEEGIDWYEVWSGLEHYEVVGKTSDSR